MVVPGIEAGMLGPLAGMSFAQTWLSPPTLKACFINTLILNEKYEFSTLSYQTRPKYELSV